MSYRHFIQLVFVSLSVVTIINAFNFSPKPNLVYYEPRIKTFKEAARSSYFGFTVNLRKSSIIVGAPRAQSTLETQRNVNETGAIYKCSLTNGQCAPFVFDNVGNTFVEYNDYTYDSEKKDNQWLGATIDGGTRDSDRLVVCAPRLLANLEPNEYLIHGVCYWTPDTKGDKPSNVKKIAPLRLKTNQVKEINNKFRFNHMFGEQGISVHVSANNEEILIGAPGIHNWKGSIIRYYEKVKQDIGGLSRRDTEGLHFQSRENIMEFVSEVPNPDLWGQADDSYFGYAVSSGYFDSVQKSKLLFVATAPQSRQQSGEAYIFETTKSPTGEFSIKKHHTFYGTQFGEYFGYSVLTEDLNGDDLPDLIISAPQYSAGTHYEMGAIYVFINKGKLTFEMQKVLVSPSTAPGRFGSTLSRLGDINHDGFMDVAVGAPFDGNGTVYIYLGGSNGLREKPSQILQAPEEPVKRFGGANMFGHGLSRGSDVDKNGYNDFAIGAPNAESVYLYRSYPVVKVVASIGSTSREITTDQDNFKVRVCYQIQTTTTENAHQELMIKVKADKKPKRVTFVSSGTNEMEFNVTGNAGNQCRFLDARVKFILADIFIPIDLEMHYEIVHGIPNSEYFCTTCVAVDPSEPTVVSQKIIFNTGCKGDICEADLQIRSSGLASNYIIGSTSTLLVEYEFTNVGETAYLPQINITSSNKLPFARIPSTCKETDHVLLCDLPNRRFLSNGNKGSLTISYDVSAVEGDSMVLTAQIFSTGAEKNNNDNIVTDVIALREFSELEAVGIPSTPIINLEKVFNSAEIVNKFEIKNNGPSNVKELEIAIMIPTAYLIPGSTKTIPIIESSNITVQAVYNGQVLPIEFYQKNTLLLQEVYETSSSSAVQRIAVDTQNGLNFDSSKIGYPLEQEENYLNTDSMSRRRRRDVAQVVTTAQYAQVSALSAEEMLIDELMGILPINRTILFNCNNPEMTSCVRAVLRIYNFQSHSDNPVAVTLKYNVDLNEVNQILIEPWEFFVIAPRMDIVKIGDEKGDTIKISRKFQYNIISKHQFYRTPIWVWILAIIGGILLLAAITYGLSRMGFFRRQKAEELEKLKRESHRVDALTGNDGETEDEG